MEKNVSSAANGWSVKLACEFFFQRNGMVLAVMETINRQLWKLAGEFFAALKCRDGNVIFISSDNRSAFSPLRPVRRNLY